MSLRFYEIAEKDHQILNPFSPEKLMLLGEICRLKPGMRQLDLTCGREKCSVDGQDQPSLIK